MTFAEQDLTLFDIKGDAFDGGKITIILLEVF